MTAVDMGSLYSKTHNGKPLKIVDSIKSELMSLFYEKHHEEFTNILTELCERDGSVLIVDCHSFPKNPLPYELDQERERAEICIGIDAFHTPIEISTALINFLKTLVSLLPLIDLFQVQSYQ